MRLIRFTRAGGHPRRGLLLAGGEVLDLEAASVPVPADPRDAWLLGSPTLLGARELLEQLSADRERLAALRKSGVVLDPEEARLLAPVPRPGKLICIGLNYRDHAEESGMPIPERPLVFSKWPSCLIGPDDAIELPHNSDQVDYEAELAFVIGKRARFVPKEAAYRYVLGYACFHDVSARDFQFADVQWQRGKSCETFAPMGPFVATTDEIPDPQNLAIKLRLQGETLQDSHTSQLIFSIPELVQAMSEHYTLEPGDVIATGTPPGVGFARKPPVFLQAGQQVEVEIQGLGVLANPVIAAAVPA
ncbi:MAG TPA: fumarylacetoacetate hydrolase family protein [Planctomycetota bacterium]